MLSLSLTEMFETNPRNSVLSPECELECAHLKSLLRERIAQRRPYQCSQYQIVCVKSILAIRVHLTCKEGLKCPHWNLWTASVGVLTALNCFQTLASCLSRVLGGLCLIQRAAGSNTWDNKSQEREIRVIECSGFLQEWRACYGNRAKLPVEMIDKMVG